MVNVPQNRHEKAPKLAVAPREDKQIWTIRNTVFAALAAISALTAPDSAKADSLHTVSDWESVLDIRTPQPSQAGLIRFPNRFESNEEGEDEIREWKIFDQARSSKDAYSEESMKAFAEVLYSEGFRENTIRAPLTDIDFGAFYNTQAETAYQALEYLKDSFDELDAKYGVEGRESPRYVHEAWLRLAQAKSLFIAINFAERKGGRDADVAAWKVDAIRLLERNVEAAGKGKSLSEDLRAIVTTAEWKRWDGVGGYAVGRHPEQEKMRRAIENKYGVYDKEHGAQYASDDTINRSKLLLSALKVDPENLAESIPDDLKYAFLEPAIRTSAEAQQMFIDEGYDILATFKAGMDQEMREATFSWAEQFVYLYMAKQFADAHADQHAAAMYKAALNVELAVRKEGFKTFSDAQLAQAIAVPLIVNARGPISVEYNKPGIDKYRSSRDFDIDDNGHIQRLDYVINVKEQKKVRGGGKEDYTNLSLSLVLAGEIEARVESNTADNLQLIVNGKRYDVYNKKSGTQLASL